MNRLRQWRQVGWVHVHRRDGQSSLSFFYLILDSLVGLWVGILSAGEWCLRRTASNPGLARGRQLVSFRFEMTSQCQSIKINTLRPRQNGRHFPDDIFKWIFLNENVWISINISLKFVPKGPINNNPTFAWGRPGDKPFSEPMMARLSTHICVNRPQSVKITNMYVCLFVYICICCVYSQLNQTVVNFSYNHDSQTHPQTIKCIAQSHNSRAHLCIICVYMCLAIQILL